MISFMNINVEWRWSNIKNMLIYFILLDFRNFFIFDIMLIFVSDLILSLSFFKFIFFVIEIWFIENNDYFDDIKFIDYFFKDDYEVELSMYVNI